VNFSLQEDAFASELRLEGRFTSQAQARFREASRKLLNTAATERVTLDLSGLTYMDSAALGMLLLLREEHTRRFGTQVVLRHPTPFVLNVLKLVQFEDLFEIQEASV
jgi:anti-anti-sigma factor